MLEMALVIVITIVAVIVVLGIVALVGLIACSILLDKWYDEQAKKGNKDETL